MGSVILDVWDHIQEWEEEWRMLGSLTPWVLVRLDIEVKGVRFMGDIVGELPTLATLDLLILGSELDI